MNGSCKNSNPLKHQGTSQTDRFLKALDPGKVKLHDLDVSDWLHFARDYARLINYYPAGNAEMPEGDWLEFFMAKDEVKTLLKRYGDGDIEPHLALFISFLKLLNHSQQSLNRLPKRHLDFYYKEVLKLKKRPFTPDRVHVLFELAQNAKQERVEKNVLLKAGDDSEGNPLQYAATNSLVVNSAKVASLKSIFVDNKGILRQAPVANSADGQGADFEEDKTWPAFGDNQWIKPELQWSEAELSFFIASRLLQLKEGKRTIKLDFKFRNPPSIDFTQLNIETRFTGETEWLQPVKVQVDKRDHSKWSIELSSEQKAVAGYKEEVHKAALKVNQPVMKVSFKPNSSYEKLKTIEIESLKLTIQVDGVQSLEMQNALGSLDPAQPFMPFGPSPYEGSRLSLFAPEMADKPITDFSANYKWLNLTDGSPNVVLNNINEPGKYHLILNDSLGYDTYQEDYIEAILIAQKNADGGTITVDLPPKPYTPLLDQLTLNYTADEEISFADLSPDDQAGVMFHQHPFGAKRVTKPNKISLPKLLPKYDEENLYIGLEKMNPGSNISLLFQVAEGSENPLHSNFKKGEAPDWSILINNDWITLKDHIVRNETNNFLRSGLIEITIPKTANTHNSLLGIGLHWIRVQLKKLPDAVPRFIGVHAQAGAAIFHNQGNTTDHLKNGLPAETINKLVHPRAALKSVAQPYASFGGKPSETDNAFYQRISERLRHKNRAVGIWDYEHIVLQQFPSLYKVKCLNHTCWNVESDSLNQLSPGNVTLVLIPKISENSSVKLRMKPQVSQNFKDEVEKFINRCNSTHANVKAVNPAYEAVKFKFDIQFNVGLDFNFYKDKTIGDLKRLLAPWAFESEAEIVFGGSFTEYEVVNYLENLDYVDYITDFKMYHLVNGGDQIQKATVAPSNPMTILVPADKHNIKKADKKCVSNGDNHHS